MIRFYLPFMKLPRYLLVSITPNPDAKNFRKGKVVFTSPSVVYKRGGKFHIVGIIGRHTVTAKDCEDATINFNGVVFHAPIICIGGIVNG